MTKLPWQEEALARLLGALEKDEAVRGLAVIGSCAGPAEEVDPWSDLDLVLVADDASLARFYPDTAWLAPVGEEYATDQSEREGLFVTRAFLAEGRQVDVVVVPGSAWGHAASPTRWGARWLIARGIVPDAAAGKSVPFAPASVNLQALANEFYFKGMLAAKKVARGDLLVALHLSLDRIRDCCVLGMLLRDRQEGTDHHRHGGSGQAFAGRLQAASQPFTAAGILESLEQSSLAFDELAALLSPEYAPRREPLLRFVQRVRQSLPLL